MKSEDSTSSEVTASEDREPSNESLSEVPTANPVKNSFGHVAFAAASSKFRNFADEVARYATETSQAVRSFVMDKPANYLAEASKAVKNFTETHHLPKWTMPVAGVATLSAVMSWGMRGFAVTMSGLLGAGALAASTAFLVHKYCPSFNKAAKTNATKLEEEVVSAVTQLEEKAADLLTPSTSFVDRLRSESPIASKSI